MKIAVTAVGEKLSDNLDPRFGRTEKIIIYDLEATSYEVLDNSESLNASGGAGIKTAEKIVNTNSTVVITGDCGPKAMNVLNAAKVKVFYSKALTVEDAINEYKEKNKA